MGWMRRILLLCAINISVMLIIGIIWSLLAPEVQSATGQSPILGLMIGSLVWGFGGALISLWISRIIAKAMFRLKVINPREAHGDAQQLLQLVDQLRRSAGLEYMPEVAIYESSEVNAFATGPSQKRSLVAVSSGLLHYLPSEQVRAVLAHEVSHIANGDMVTMTLLQGLVNSFVLFLSRVLALGLAMFMRRDQRDSSVLLFRFSAIAFQLLLMIPGTMIIMAYSRWREYRADAGAARLTSPKDMIAALQSLGHMPLEDAAKNPRSFAAFKINVDTPNKRGSLFASHPTIEQRIERLKNIGRPS